MLLIIYIMTHYQLICVHCLNLRIFDMKYEYDIQKLVTQNVYCIFYRYCYWFFILLMYPIKFVRAISVFDLGGDMTYFGG